MTTKIDLILIKTLDSRSIKRLSFHSDIQNAKQFEFNQRETPFKLRKSIRCWEGKKNTQMTLWKVELERNIKLHS